MRVLCAWITVGLFALVPNVAMADVISDEEAQCRSQKAGDACSIGGEAGTCQQSTCSRNDYSEGVPPKTKQVDCMVCKAGAAPEPIGEEAKAEDAKDEKPAAEAGKDAKAGSEDAGKSKSSGCSVGGPAPLGLGLLLVGGVMLGRRRD
ncbi:MAG: hypothetical protein ACRBN8_35455 [Nannocystales bacterium]